MPERACDVENIADFGRYYTHRWVGYHSSDSPFVAPAYVVGQDRNDNIRLRFLEKRDKGFVLGSDANFDFAQLRSSVDFGRPDIGMMQDGSTIVFLAHATPRQPHKGLSTREVWVDEFNTSHLSKVYKSLRPNRSGGERHDWVWNAFNPEYYSFTKALQSVQEGLRVGTPISRNLAVYSMPEIIHPVVAYKRWAVGYVANPELIHLNQKYEGYKEVIREQTQVDVQMVN